MKNSKTIGTAGAAGHKLPRELDTLAVQQLMRAGGDLTLVLDGAGTVLDVHAHDGELEKAMRRDWRGRAWRDTVTIESHDKIDELLASGLAGAAAAPRQVNHPVRGGVDLPVQYTTVLLAPAGAQPDSARLAALGRDLRDTMALQRRLVEAQQTMERDYWRFREAETRYRNLFQFSTEAVLIVDGSSLRIAEANPAAVALLGAGNAGKAGRLIGSPLAALFDASAAEPLSAALAAARSVGKHEQLSAALAGAAAGQRRVQINITSFRQDQAAYLLLRLTLQDNDGPGRGRAGGRAAADGAGDTGNGIAERFVLSASDALVFTDGSGRVTQANPAFVRLAQLSSADQARGELLDRWLGRTGVELPVLVANLREHGSAGLFATELRGALGIVTEVEVAASLLPGDSATFAFAMRDIGRRLAPSEQDLPTKVPASVQQLTELVGRVPLKQIVAETSDLIEKLSIETALQMTRDNRAMAAQLLGLSRQSLYVKLRRFSIGGLEPDAP